MKNIYRFLIILLLTSIIYTSSYAISTEYLYTSFLIKIEKKYNNVEKQEDILNLLQDRISQLQNTNISSTSKKQLEGLEKYNNEEIFSRWEAKNLSISEREKQEKNIKKLGDIGKIPYSQMTKDFQGYLKYNWKIQEKEGVYYAYNFQNSIYFDDKYGISKKNLEANNILESKNYIYVDKEDNVFFLRDYEKTKLLAGEKLWGLANKKDVLVSLGKDARYQFSDTEKIWGDISATVKKITDGKKDEEKIQKIYAWILENLSYSKNIDLSDKKIFSAIEGFKNKSGVCTSYARLFQYMLSIAGINDVEVIEGHVIDAADFPRIGHAWVRIGDKYYDPTFDDPLGAIETKTREQYKYFGLPKDLFYANRFDYGSLPEEFKIKTDSQIQEYIHNYLTNLIPKYKNSLGQYSVFNPVIFRNKYNISSNTIITPEILASKIRSYKVENNSFRFKKGSKTEQITHVKYYTIDSSNTENVLRILNYDVDKLSLFDWELDDGTRKWRLAYELDLR